MVEDIGTAVGFVEAAGDITTPALITFSDTTIIISRGRRCRKYHVGRPSRRRQHHRPGLETTGAADHIQVRRAGIEGTYTFNQANSQLFQASIKK